MKGCRCPDYKVTANQFLTIAVLSAMFSITYKYLHNRKPPFKQLTYLNLGMMLNECHNIISGIYLPQGRKTQKKVMD